MRDQYKVLAEKYNQVQEVHRLGGPTIVWANGTKEWLLGGRYHRLDGPAIEWTDGTKEWFINGKNMTKDEFNREIQRRDILKRASDETGIETDI